MQLKRFFIFLFTFYSFTASASQISLHLVTDSPVNLIANPDAEAGSGSVDGGVVSVPSWVVSGNFTVVKYGVGSGFPDDTTPGLTNRGLNFFSGGPSNASSEATQLIDISSNSSSIDAGRQTFTLSGYFGGYADHGDNTTLTVTFQDAANQALGSATIGPVTNQERGNLTSFFPRSINGLVPVLTRKVLVKLVMIRYSGSYNDGYADNLFFGLGSASGGIINGKVYNDSATAGNEVNGAFIQACLTGGGCLTTTSSSTGEYLFSNLAAGQYSLLGFPPGGNYRLTGGLGPLALPAESTLANQNIILRQPGAPPPGTTITNRGTTSNNIPVVYWTDILTLRTIGCSGGTATYQILKDGVVKRNGNMSESPAGTYTAVIAALKPLVGAAYVSITLQCPSGPPTQIDFSIWIDPSGVVVNTINQPIYDATLTLYRSEVSTGPFDIVVSGTAIMSPANRVNPMKSDTLGLFGWDVVAGYYKVRAEKQGCSAPDNHSQLYVETTVLTIPPPETNLRLVLYCGEKIAVFLPLTKK